MNLAAIRLAYDGFTHAGLTTVLAPAPRARGVRVLRVDGEIVDTAGRVVGAFTRLVTAGRVRHERIELDPVARGRGFARALQAHVEPIYRAHGVEVVTMHAEDIGSLLWPRLGFDFDLRRVRGATEDERRRRAVLALLSPDARRVAGRPLPCELLERWVTDPARREAALDLRSAMGVGALLDPVALADFDAGATGIGRELMLAASFDAVKQL